MKYAIQLLIKLKLPVKTIYTPITPGGWIESAPTISIAIEQFVNRPAVAKCFVAGTGGGGVADHMGAGTTSFVLSVTEEGKSEQLLDYEQWGTLIKPPAAASPIPEPDSVAESAPVLAVPAKPAVVVESVFPLEVQPPPAPGEPYVTLDMIARLENGASIVFRDARGVGVAFVDFVREIKRLNRVNAELTSRLAAAAESGQYADGRPSPVEPAVTLDRSLPLTPDIADALTQQSFDTLGTAIQSASQLAQQPAKQPAKPCIFVLREIIKVIPDSEAELKARLQKIVNETFLELPEDLSVWRAALKVLSEFIPESSVVESSWQKRVIDIWQAGAGQQPTKPDA